MCPKRLSEAVKLINQNDRSPPKYKCVECYSYTSVLLEILGHAAHVCGTRTHTHTHTHTHTPAKAVFTVVVTVYTFIHTRYKGFVLILYSSKTNKMQRYAMVFFTVNALHVSGGSSTHHQELKTVYTASGIVELFLLLTAIVSELELTVFSS